MWVTLQRQLLPAWPSQLSGSETRGACLSRFLGRRFQQISPERFLGAYWDVLERSGGNGCVRVCETRVEGLCPDSWLVLTAREILLGVRRGSSTGRVVGCCMWPPSAGKAGDPGSGRVRPGSDPSAPLLLCVQRGRRPSSTLPRCPRVLRRGVVGAKALRGQEGVTCRAKDSGRRSGQPVTPRRGAQAG